MAANLGYYHLLGVIQGPLHPHSTQPFLKVFVDDMVKLYHEGCIVNYPLYAPLHGLAQKADACVKVALFAIMNDLPAANEVCGARGHAAPDSCRFCLVEGTYHAALHLSSWNPVDYIKCVVHFFTLSLSIHMYARSFAFSISC